MASFWRIIGKYFLVIVSFLIGGMIYCSKNGYKRESNYLIPMAMIFAGAIGNLIDGMFYG
jgi:signal peptidase II